MKTSRACLLLSCTLTGMVALAAAESAPGAKDRPRITADERIAQLGGYVVYPGSQKGLVAFIDTQGAVDVARPFDEVFSHFRRQVPVRIELSKAEAGSPLALKANAKADFAVVLVHDDVQPSLTVVPDDGYAVVNLARYRAGLKFPDDAARYGKRCAKAALKAFSMLCGGCASRYPGHVMAAHSPQELDFSQERLPIDMQESIKKYLGAAGVTPLRRTIYRRACQEGWAPTPTNDAQKAIWQQVHQIPDKPIKIEFDPKKDK